VAAAAAAAASCDGGEREGEREREGKNSTRTPRKTFLIALSKKKKTGEVSQAIAAGIVEGKCYVPPASTAASAAAVGT